MSAAAHLPPDRPLSRHAYEPSDSAPVCRRKDCGRTRGHPVHAEPTIEGMVLTSLQARALASQKRAAWHKASISVREDMASIIADDLIVQLDALVLAEHLDSHTATATELTRHNEPASPWQMVKRDWYFFRETKLGKRFLRKFPIRYRVIVHECELVARFERYLTFPESQLEIPPEVLGKPVRLLKLSEERVEVRRVH